MWIAEKIYYQGSSGYTRAYQGDELVWESFLANTLKFTAKENNTTVGLKKKSSYHTVQYTTNGTSWLTMTTATTVNLSSGDTIYIRGTLSSNNTTSNYTNFKFSGDVAISGNLNYLWNYQAPDTALKKYCGYFLFSDCTAITDASELVFPATTLAQSCYMTMFQNCHGLTTAPSILPATTLADSCYRGMFQYTPITTAPELPATTLSTYCYQYMFRGCEHLNYIKCLATNISATNCTYNWVNGVATSGTFVSNPNMYNWTIGVNGIPTDWIATNYFRLTAKANNSSIGLTALSTGQTLEYNTDGTTWSNMTTATTINLSSGDTVYVRGILSSNNSDSNYTQFIMDGNIKASGNINYLWDKDNPNTALKNGCGIALFSGCTALTDVVDLELPATTLSERCYRNMFRNTRITTAPVLPATTLATYCYSSMFNTCTSLTTAPALPATTLATYCYYYMFENCTSLQTAPELTATTLTQYCYYNMFRNCTSLNYIKCLATNISASNCTYNWVNSVASTGTFVKNENMTSWTRSTSGIPVNWTVENEFAVEPVKFTAKQNSSTLGLQTKSSVHTIEYSTDGGNTWSNMTTSTNLTVNSGNSVYVRGVLSGNQSDSNYTRFKMSGDIKASGNINYLWNKNNPDSALKEYCGYALFNSCTALTETSELVLPATLIANNCYHNMFNGCTSLTTAPSVLPATTLADSCYRSMFQNCSSLTAVPDLPATSLTNNCYRQYAQGTAIQRAPELSATTLVTECYRQIFYNCTRLNYIKCLATNISASNCTYSWVLNVAASGTFVKNTSMTSWTTGNNGIPNGWTITDA